MPVRPTSNTHTDATQRHTSYQVHTHTLEDGKLVFHGCTTSQGGYGVCCLASPTLEVYHQQKKPNECEDEDEDEGASGPDWTTGARVPEGGVLPHDKPTAKFCGPK